MVCERIKTRRSGQKKGVASQRERVKYLASSGLPNAGVILCRWCSPDLPRSTQAERADLSPRKPNEVAVRAEIAQAEDADALTSLDLPVFQTPTLNHCEDTPKVKKLPRLFPAKRTTKLTSQSVYSGCHLPSALQLHFHLSAQRRNVCPSLSRRNSAKRRLQHGFLPGPALIT